jgi:cation diffusion facilitator family transporter
LPRITKTGALKASLAAIVSAILIEAAAGYVTGSLALVSDAAHAVFDAVSTLMLLVTTSFSLKPADEDHTYGHGKIETLGALSGGIALLILAGAIVGLALSRFDGGVKVEAGLIGYGAAAYTIVIDVLRVSILTIALKTGSLAVRADLYHAISDFVSTGLVFVGLGLTSLGYPVGDTLASVVITSLLIYLSLRLIYASSLELSDAVSGKLVKSIMDEIKKTDEVLRVKELRARRAGQMTYVDVVIAVSPYTRVVEADTIASRIEANLTRILGTSSIMIHIEPLEWGIPVELQIRNATRKVHGARGIHNLSVTTIEGGLFVTLHVQVDAQLALDHANEIAESIERGIRESVPNIRQVTVHLEPLIAESTSGMKIDDNSISNAVRAMVEKYSDTVTIISMMIYSTSEGMHVNVRCRFNAEDNIAEVHDLMSKIENEIKHRFANAIVTIQPEPMRRRTY